MLDRVPASRNRVACWRVARGTAERRVTTRCDPSALTLCSYTPGAPARGPAQGVLRAAARPAARAGLLAQVGLPRGPRRPLQGVTARRPACSMICALARSSPCGHPQLWKPTRLVRATFCAREEKPCSRVPKRGRCCALSLPKVAHSAAFDHPGRPRVRSGRALGAHLRHLRHGLRGHLHRHLRHLPRRPGRALRATRPRQEEHRRQDAN